MTDTFDCKYTRLQATIEEALITVLVPENWNHLALLYAHGHRPVGSIRNADFDLTEVYFQDLLKAGWVLGMTSYRREGRIIRDAMKDMNNLRNFICNEVGIADQFILEGRSMGGCICTHLAEVENISKLYDGVLAIGAALITTDPEPIPALPFTHQPEIPILFLINESETGPIEAYINEARASDAPIVPALWRVAREGHNWTNSAERSVALRSLMSWIHYKTFITCRQYNNTQSPPYRPSEMEITETVRGRPAKGSGKVTGINLRSVFLSNFQPRDFETLGILLGKKFSVINQQGKRFEFIYSIYPFIGVPMGALKAYETPEGYIEFATHSYEVNHTSTLVGVEVGDTFEIAYLIAQRTQLSIPENLLPKQ